VVKAQVKTRHEDGMKADRTKELLSADWASCGNKLQRSAHPFDYYACHRERAWAR
jgi:hypothetical protein